MGAYSTYTDQELTALLKGGDRIAYTEIYDRYKSLLYRHTYKKLGDADEAQDVLQDVFLNLWNKREHLLEAQNVSGYLYTAIRNKVLNLFAQKKVRSKYEVSLLEFSESESAITDHLVREHQLSALIEQEINAMPEKMRAVFTLSRTEHLKNKEIAERLGISEHTVATQMKRALKHLRVRLGLVVYLTVMLQAKSPIKAQKINQNIFQVLYPIVVS
ncbi:RNA polymerase sigma-70 factor (ECF subfamily) [Pedobacter sp. AK017]|uniref:RNA polymerase sigma factor n=1 Tax=Pedobacter sp. AK017 TaxID=2723073 RepID=UPI00161AC2C8|nr:RNA polymerase sigma-70 factor [Pedobacter sp. AK017]MBB5440866.1 RNA polymerase sigma-70 factor (ECF subfamily) [Pedobacter sp. AK017]